MEELVKYLKEHGVLDSLKRKLDIDAMLAEFEVRDIKADASENRVYTYFDTMDTEPVRECIDTLSMWARRDDDKDITILLNSPGGYCDDGFALYDWIREIRHQYKKHIEIVGLGQVSSMATIVMQAADHRVLHKNSWFLLHEVAYDTPDGYYDAKTSIQGDMLKQAQRLEVQGTKILASRSIYTVKELKEKMRKTDFWLSAKEALDAGFIDEVR